MIVLRPDGPSHLEKQVADACASGPGRPQRTLLVLVQGTHPAEILEPLATLSEALAGVESTLQLVVTQGWSPAGWEGECHDALDPLAPSPDQRRRALTQRAHDGRLEVLFVERGRIVGSALSLVAPRRDGPVTLNVKLAAMELLQSARDALVWEPRVMEQLVRDAREALGIPAGRMSTVAAVRALRGPLSETPSRKAEDIGQQLRQAMKPAPKPVAPPAPEERHAVTQGRCTTCGRTGASLSEPCGRPELGRFGLIELD